MNTARDYFFLYWRAAVGVLSLALIAYLLYFSRLGSLLPGYSASEVATYHSALSWHQIASNPINAPFRAVLWVGSGLLHQGLLTGRVVAACFGIIAAAGFFFVIRPWYGFRVAFLATIMFATSAGFLHAARLGTGQILQMGILAFIGAVLWYRHQQAHRIALGYWFVLLFALLWYIPGMLWFELFGLILLRHGLWRQMRQMSTWNIVGWTLVFLAAVSPLVLASLRSPHILYEVTGLPASLHAWSHVGSNFVNLVLSVGIYSKGNPQFWVGHAPLLNVVELALGAIGAYFYLYRQRSARTVFLTGATILAAILVSFGGSVGPTALIPLLYLFIASGVEHLLGQWLRVFPRNPLARMMGVSVVCIMLFFSVLYQTRAYFVAWPHNTATEHTFKYSRP